MSVRAWDAYNAGAEDYIKRYESYSAQDALDGVEDVIAGFSGAMLDVGAGTGRDARWFKGKGFDVTAVEPSAKFREYGVNLSSDIRWVDDTLPKLQKIRSEKSHFDFILLNASWQHVPSDERQEAFETLYNLCKPKGRIMITLRYGPTPPDRIMYPVSYTEIEALASRHASLCVSGKDYRRKSHSLVHPEVVFGRAIIDKVLPPSLGEKKTRT